MFRDYYEAALLLEAYKASGEVERIKSVHKEFPAGGFSANAPTWKLALILGIKERIKHYDPNVILQQFECIAEGTDERDLSSVLMQFKDVTAEITDDATLKPINKPSDYITRNFFGEMPRNVSLSVVEKPNELLRNEQEKLYRHFESLTLDCEITALVEDCKQVQSPQLSVRKAYALLKRHSLDDNDRTQLNEGEIKQAALTIFTFMKSDEFHQSNIRKRVSFEYLNEHNYLFIQTPLFYSGHKDGNLTISKYKPVLKYHYDDDIKQLVAKLPDAVTELSHTVKFENNALERACALDKLGIPLDEVDKSDMRYVSDYFYSDLDSSINIIEAAANTVCPFACTTPNVNNCIEGERVAMVLDSRLQQLNPELRKRILPEIDNRFIKESMTEIESERLCHSLTELLEFDEDTMADIQMPSHQTLSL